MRLNPSHKVTTYLMVFCAFAALALSGELSTLLIAVGIVAIVASWKWEPHRFRLERFHNLWTVIAVCAFCYTLFSMLFRGDFLLAGCRFLVVLLLIKLFNRRGLRDYQHIYILTFLVLVAGTVLNTEFTYGIFFLGYVVAFTWALILFHLRRAIETHYPPRESRASSHSSPQQQPPQIIGKPFFFGTALISISIFCAASLLFLMVPRIGFGLFFSKSRSAVTMTGFSDGVKLGGHGTIKTDKTVVMRVKVDAAYQGRSAPSLHWRGVAFNRYHGGQWSRTKTAPKSRRTVTLTRGKEIHHLLYNEPTPTRSTLDTRMEGALRQEIYLEPLGYDVLFAAAMPLAFEFDAKWRRKNPRTDHNDEIRFAHASGAKYTVYSAIKSPPPSQLRNAPAKIPEGYEVYLQIPDEVSEPVKQLAQKITKDANTPYDKLMAIHRWLQSNMSYTLRMKSPGDIEPLHFFLLERKQGHCEYFSSAMAILARIVGIPTRNVNGFLGGEWNEYDQYIAVRAGDAHSWMEAYFHGVGWVAFDPTPSAEVDSGRGDENALNQMRRLLDTLRFKWFKWVIEYDLYRQLSLFKKLGKSLGGGSSTIKHRMRNTGQWLKNRSRPVLLLVILVCVIVVMFAALHYRNKDRHSRKQQRKRHSEVAAIYRRVAALLGKYGHLRIPSHTPREHALALRQQNTPGAEPFAELTETYYAAEYGADSDPALVTNARLLEKAVVRALPQKRSR